MDIILKFLQDNIISLSFLATAIVGIVNFYQFVATRKDEQRQRDYHNYHSLIERLNLPEAGTGYPLLDKQKSAVFELRYYSKYKMLTHDILSEWIPKVKESGLDKFMKETLKELGVPYDTQPK
jgi:hypothetical protein